MADAVADPEGPGPSRWAAGANIPQTAIRESSPQETPAPPTPPDGATAVRISDLPLLVSQPDGDTGPAKRSKRRVEWGQAEEPSPPGAVLEGPSTSGRPPSEKARSRLAVGARAGMPRPSIKSSSLAPSRGSGPAGVLPPGEGPQLEQRRQSLVMLKDTVNTVGQRAQEGRLTIFSRSHWRRMLQQCFLSAFGEIAYCAVLASILTIIEGEELYLAGKDAFPFADKATRGLVKFNTALYIVYTSVVTIGYGDLVPLSNSGRWFLMITCTAGNVFNIINVIRLIKVLTSAFALLSGRLGLHDSGSVFMMESASFGTLLFVLVFGNAAIWQQITGASGEEPWSYTEAVWFSWATFLTVGYGDYAITAMQYVTPLTLVWMYFSQWLGLAVAHSCLGRGVEFFWKRRDYSQQEKRYRLKERIKEVGAFLRSNGFLGLNFKAGPRGPGVSVVSSIVTDAEAGTEQKDSDSDAGPSDFHLEPRRVATFKMRKRATGVLLTPLAPRQMADTEDPAEEASTSNREPFRPPGERLEQVPSLSIRVPEGMEDSQINMRRIGDVPGLERADKRAELQRHTTGLEYPVLSQFLDIDEGTIDYRTNTVTHTLL